MPVYLVKNGISSRIIATDISPGSLSKARDLIVKESLEGIIETRIGSGLKVISCLLYTSNAMTITDFKLDRLQAQYDLDNQEEKVEFTTKAVRILTDVDNLLERDIYIQRLNNLTGFRPELLYRYVEQVENRGGKPGLKKNKIGNNRHTTPIRKARIHIAANIKAEMHLIRLMASDEELSLIHI